jgi:hypothetical protein
MGNETTAGQRVVRSSPICLMPFGGMIHHISTFIRFQESGLTRNVDLRIAPA